MTKQDKRNFNILLGFLAKRDFECVEDILEMGKMDLAVIMPSAYMPVAYEMVKMYEMGVAENYIIAGGLGHSTHFISDNIKINPKFLALNTEGKSEAEMYFDILNLLAEGKKDNVFLDTKSTNSGENAAFALDIAIQYGLEHGKVLVMQDPTMQMRTYLTFKKVWDAQLFSYTPIVPVIDEKPQDFAYEQNMEGLWSEQRLISLLLGEMYRVEDNPTGYGPKGKNYIAHIDLPNEIKRAYRALYEKYTETRTNG